MKRKLITVILTLSLIVTGALGIITAASADETDGVTIIDVNYDTSWNALSVHISEASGTGNDGAWDVYSDQQKDKISLLRGGIDIFSTAHVMWTQPYILINIGQGVYTPQEGDILVIRNGFKLATGSEFKKEIKYICKSTGAPWEEYTEELPDISDEKPELKINKVAFSSAWNALVAEANVITTTQGSDATWGEGEILNRFKDYITLVNSKGENILQKLYFRKSSGEIMINLTASYTPQVGDKLTFKKGFELEGGIAKEDIVYECKNATNDVEWVNPDEQAPENKEVDLKLLASDSTFAYFNSDWKITADTVTMAVKVHFDTADWEGDVGLYADIKNQNQGLAYFVDHAGKQVELNDITYIGTGNFLFRTEGLLKAGARLVIKENFTVSIGTVQAVNRAEMQFILTSTSDGAIPQFNDSMIPSTLEITTPEGEGEIPVETTLQLSYSIPEGTYGTPVFTSDHPETATVDENGSVTGVAEGEAVITAAIGEAKDTYKVTVIKAMALQGLELVDAYKLWVPVNGEFKLPELKARAVYEDNYYGTAFDLVEGENMTVPEVSTETAGEQTITLSVVYKDKTYELDYMVEVYEIADMTIKELGIVDWFSYFLFIQVPDSSTNTANITDTGKFADVLDHISYTREDGTDVKISGFYMLGSNIALSIFSGLDESNYNEYYRAGDMITIEAGFTAYKWTGELKVVYNDKGEVQDNSAIDEGTGMFIKESVLKETVQYRYDGNVWGFFLEYTDMTVASEEVTLEMGGSPVSVGANRVPANATSGKIEYSTSNDQVATVSPMGVIVAVGEGTATITAKLSGGAAGEITKTVQVNVIDPITGIKFDKDELTFTVGEQLDLTTLHAVYEYGSGKTGEAVDLTSATVTGLDTSVAGEGMFVISVTVNGKTYSGAIKYTVTEVPADPSGCEGCNGGAGTASFGALALVIAAAKKRSKNSQSE